MKLIKGFRIIEVPLGDKVEGFHFLYIREHVGNKVNKDDAGKVLFVGNVDYRIAMTPEDIDDYLRLIFERFGDIVNVYVSAVEEGAAATTKCAHVQFAKKSSLKLALNGNDSDYKIGCNQVSEKFGLVLHKASVSEIQKKHKFIDCDADELQEEVDSFMAEFDENELIMKKEREERLNQVDEDGFMPVKNRNKRKRSLEGGLGGPENDDFTPVGGTESTSRKAGAPRSRKTKTGKKSTELKNFYRFQIKEEKIKELDSLRKKFAEDQLRVAKMKELRKFKPF